MTDSMAQNDILWTAVLDAIGTVTSDRGTIDVSGVAILMPKVASIITDMDTGEVVVHFVDGSTRVLGRIGPVDPNPGAT